MGRSSAAGAAQGHGRTMPLRLFVAIFYALAAPEALAQSPYSLLAGASATYDTNVFRLPASANVQALLGEPTTADWLFQRYAGVRVDKPWSLQRFQLEARGSQYRYRRFSHLDFEALDYRAAWLYSVTPRLSGALRADRSQSLVPFSDFQGRQRNVRVSETRSFTAEASASPSLQALFGASQSVQRSSVAVLAESDFSMARAEAGLRYVARSASTVTFMQRWGDGAYINRPAPAAGADNGFKQADSDLQATWALTPRTQLRSRMNWFSREHDNFSQQDDSGYAAQVGVAWDTTAKLRTDLLVSRGKSPYFDGLSSYRRDDSFTLAPTWQALPKVPVRLRVQHTRTEHYAPAPGARVERLLRLELGSDWLATRNATFGARIERQTRSSSDPAFRFETTITSFNVSLTF